MRRTATILLAHALVLGCAAGAAAGRHHRLHDLGDGLDIDFEGDTLVLTHDDYRGDAVEITREADLIVNDDRVRTGRAERRLLRAYYDRALQIEVVALELGEEGARIGVQGASLAAHALIRVVKLLSPDYDSDDLEREMEEKSEKIEIRAEALEERAEELEELVDEMEDLADDLRERVPELEALGWF
jgi:hypothetical protein